MPFSDEDNTLINIAHTSSKNTVHGGYWQNFRSKRGKEKDWTLY